MAAPHRLPRSWRRRFRIAAARLIVGTTSYGKGTVQTVVRLANEGRADPDLVAPAGAVAATRGTSWACCPNICTSKVADADQLGPNSLDSSQGTLMRWHALRNPTHQEVTDLRKICPPGDNSPELDVVVATRLLHDHSLYAHAVQAAYPAGRQPIGFQALDTGRLATTLPAFREFAPLWS